MAGAEGCNQALHSAIVIYDESIDFAVSRHAHALQDRGAVPRRPKIAKKARTLPKKVADCMAPQVRLELTTLRLTAECSAIELLRNEKRGLRG
jgi:hypothetical protein